MKLRPPERTNSRRMARPKPEDAPVIRVTVLVLVLVGPSYILVGGEGLLGGDEAHCGYFLGEVDAGEGRKEGRKEWGEEGYLESYVYCRHT